jgi:transcriptional regulator with PAS, ATPase and Fis domain
MRRYRRLLFDRMTDISTLVMGASGTGKELVARAIGLSRYIPFDATRGGFVEDFEGSFIALNLSAMSPTLIESELFGHRRGAFTGAVADRVGFLEACPPLGTVFLDEIGELDAGDPGEGSCA